MPTISYRSFAAGEVSPRLGARVDQTKYQTGAHTMRNFLPTLEGAAQNRAGLGYVRPGHDFTADDAPRLIPFVFSENESYVLVLEHERLSFITQAAPLFDASVAITGATAALPCVVTAVGHGLTTGDLIWIDEVEGMTQLNRRFFRAVVLTPDTVELEQQVGIDIDATAYTAYSAGGTLQKVYTMATPWDGADLRQIRYAQTADVMFFTHPDYPPYQLVRAAGPVWTLEEVAFGPRIDAPVGVSGSGTPGTDTARYRVTAVDADTGEESLVSFGNLVQITSLTDFPPGPWKPVTAVTSANPPTITCAAHGYIAGDTVQIVMTSGALQASGFWEVFNTTANTFQLRRNGENVNGTGWTAGVDVGEVRIVYRTFVLSDPHSLADGDEVILTGMEGAYASLNGKSAIVSGPNFTSATFNLRDRYYTGFGDTSSPVAGYLAKSAFTIFSVVAPSSGDPINLAWTAVDNALEYNIYREINGIYGYIGTSAIPSFEDEGYSVDPFDTPPVDRTIDNPKAVGLFQQRLLLAGATANTERIDAGRTGLLYNFTKSNPIQADDSFGWVMRSKKVQAVQHILEMSRCMIFTDSAIWTMEGDEAGTLLPTAINPRKRAEHGLGDVEPIAVGNAVLYVQATGAEVNEILPGTGEDFNTKDLTVYSRHLFDDNTILAWSYAQSPVSVVWCARDDGTFLSLIYLREHDIWGWTPHETGSGDDRVVGMATVPENGESVTYFAVMRRIGSSEYPYIERMASRQIAEACDGRFLDSHRVYESANEDPFAYYTLNYDDLLTGTATWYLTRSGTTPNWTLGTADQGRVILLKFQSVRVWCTIQQVVDADNAIVSLRCNVPGSLNRQTGAPNSAGIEPTDEEPDLVPFPFGDSGPMMETITWSQSIDEVTDLWHLEGNEVYAVADGFPQGPFTVDNGRIELTAPGVLVVVGLRIDALLSTLEPENQEGETWADAPKTCGTITARVQRTSGIEIGASLARMHAWDAAWRESQVFDEGDLYTGRLTVPNLATQTPHGRVYVRQRSGLPATILGLYPQLEIGEK